MKRYLFIPAGILILCISINNCATMFHQDAGEVNFTSNPNGAEVVVDGLSLGNTPVMLDLDSTKAHTVVIRNKNGLEKTFVLKRKIGVGWVVLDIFTGFFILIDVISGDWYDLQPKKINAQFDFGD
jgi:hypothetical protein